MTRHMPSQQQQATQVTNAKANADQEALAQAMSQQVPISQSFGSGLAGGESQGSSSPALGNTGGNGNGNGNGNGQGQWSNKSQTSGQHLLQQQMSGSSWSNTPAAPLNLQESLAVNYLYTHKHFLIRSCSISGFKNNCSYNKIAFF